MKITQKEVLGKEVKLGNTTVLSVVVILRKFQVLEKVASKLKRTIKGQQGQPWLQALKRNRFDWGFLT